MQHGLEYLLADANAGKADWKSGNCSLDRHDGKKVCYDNVRPQGVSRAQKSGEGRQMRHQRGAKSNRRGDPMPRIKMIGGRDFYEFIAPREFVGQPVKEIKPTDYKTGDEACNRNAEEDEQDPEITSRLVGLRQQIETHADQS